MQGERWSTSDGKHVWIPLEVGPAITLPTDVLRGILDLAGFTCLGVETVPADAVVDLNLGKASGTNGGNESA